MAYFQTDSLWISDLGDGVAAIVLDVVDRKVNVIADRFLDDFNEALERVQANRDFRLLVIRSGKPGNFCAGADLQRFRSGGSAEEAGRLSAHGQRVFNKLADLRVPSVAVIAGSCLGGGLELALACDYRVVVAKAETRLGLPEIELGLIPAWGGTQRLPRTIGLERAFQLMLGGRRLNALQAWQWKLADRVLPTEDDVLADFPDSTRKRTRHRLPLQTWRQRLFESTRFGRTLIVRGAHSVLRRRLPDDMPAPFEVVQAVNTGLRHGFAAGLEYERAALGRLVQTPACRNLVRVFHLREDARKPADVGNARPVRKIAVIGGGIMGTAIVQLAVLKGFNVVVREANETALGFSMLRIMGLLQQAVERGLISAGDLQQKLAAVQGTTAWKSFEDVDLIIEAIPEDLARKRALFIEAEQNTRPDTVFASNTSSLRIADMQQGMQRPEQLGGLHFFNPVHKMPLVEVARGPHTSADTAATLTEFARALGKTPLLVHDGPGFVVNRVLIPYLNEAVQIVAEGVRIALVDEAMRLFGMALGPLELLDQIGIDIAVQVGQAVSPVFAERLHMSPAFAALVERGWLGRKSGAGFYRYRKHKKRVNRLAESLLHQMESATPYQQAALSKADQMAEIRERLVGLMVNEATRCLDEKLADDADTIDLAMILGSGWAPHRGGPLRYAADIAQARQVQAVKQ